MPSFVKPVASFEPEAILAQLSTDEKCLLLSGDDMWHTAPVERLGIPRARMSDGPNGVRGTRWLAGAPASCFPAATALGASFDYDLVQRIGMALGDECRARGVHCLLGPTTNIQRNPLGGRGFESFSEDPYLSGTLALAWIEGVQSRKVMTTPKHFVANEQEFQRRSNNSVVDERTLTELYLEPFRIQCKARPSGFMTSYNRVNGVHAAESPYLLRKILREDFEFDGLLMSDWSGTYSSAEAIKASLDLEMPGPPTMRGALLQRDITSGKLTVADIDECALRVLRFVKEAMESGIPFEAEEESIDNEAVRLLLRESAASGVVLLKNERNLLPLHPKAGAKIAVIGPNSNLAVISGGGSASLRPTYTVSPLKAITEMADKFGATVAHAPGADTSRWSPLLTEYLRLPGGKLEDPPQVQIDFYDRNPHAGEKLAPIFTQLHQSSYSYFIDGIPAYVPVRGWVVLRASFIPDVSGTWEFGLGVAGQANLYINDELVVDNSTKQEPGLLFFTTGAKERLGLFEVEAGRVYSLEVRFSNFQQINPSSPYAGRRGGIRVGGQRKYGAQEQISSAVALSREADHTILVIGTTPEWESESYDRDDMKLPRDTNKLVQALLKANPNTIVVNQSGMPVEFDWIDSCSTLMQAFFGGNEGGTAIADCLFGRHNPSGKLPVTFPVKLEDVPSTKTFGHPTDTVYAEGLKVGYRYFDRPGAPRSAFPFGFGLSYTSFAYSDLVVEATSSLGLSASFTLTNVGEYAGAEVAQVYIHRVGGRVERPEVELKGFKKVGLTSGESKRITVEMDHSALSYYDVTLKKWVGERGTFEVRVGGSSTQVAVVAPFFLEDNFSWIGHQKPERCALY